jgi:HlyD family secretion protein
MPTLLSKVSAPNEAPPSTGSPSMAQLSGLAMDVAIEKRHWTKSRIAVVATFAMVAVALGAWWSRSFLPQLSSSAQTVGIDRISISAVTEGTFDDFIPLRGIATPLNTTFLDAVEGGRVEKKMVEDGAAVSVGQPLVVLSNSQLQLDVIRSESEVTNQLNNLRTIEIQLERNRAENERAINEINWQLKRISQKATRDERLAAIGFIAPAVSQDSKDEDAYWRNRLDITRRGQQTDEQLQATQVQQLRTATRQLEANLALARANLDALTVRAPVAGQLTAFDINLGQSLTRGQRLGQIDSPEAARVVVSIDEFYLSRVAVGQTASLDWEGKSYPMNIRKLNPQVKNGQFEGELIFAKEQPKGLRRGQTLQAKLALGESKTALLLPAGAFLNEGGGSFVFVVAGDEAVKRPVKLGRRNVSFVEVLSGLQSGDRVVTSSYAGLADKERLTLSR